MEYLIGSSAQLARTWAAWSVGSTREIGQPDRVAHSALVYGITAGGGRETLPPPPLRPRQDRTRRAGPRSWLASSGSRRRRFGRPRRRADSERVPDYRSD